MSQEVSMDPDKEELPGVSIQEYLDVLRRRRSVIIQTFVLVSVVGIIATLLVHAVYQGQAKLLVEGRSLSVNTVDTTNPLSSLFALNQEQSVETQVEVLQSKPLLDKVKKEVGDATISVSEIKDTNVILVNAEATDPKVAAAACNKLLQFYMTDDADQNLNEVRSAKDFVEQQGRAARSQLIGTELLLKKFKQKNHLAELSKNRDDQIARVTSLTADYEKVHMDLVAAESQIQVNRAILAREPAALPVHLSSTNPGIGAIKDEIRKLQIDREGLTQNGGFTSHSPQIEAIDSQLRELNRRLQQEPVLTDNVTSTPNALREGVRAKIADLEAQKAALEAQSSATSAALAEAKVQAGSFAGWEVSYARLMRDRDEAAAADKMLTEKFTDLSLREKARHLGARVIESAEPPIHPIRPKKILDILLSCLLGLFIGCVLALAQEYLDDRVNSEEDATRVLGISSLGRVPALSPTDARLLLYMPGGHPASESYRILRTNIHFASIDRALSTLVITSSAPGEGKTTTAANLAFAMVMDGKKVIIVDTDLRRPSLNKLLDVPLSPGITNVLLGEMPFEDALVKREDLPGLSILTAGTIAPNPGELLGSRTFRALVEQLKQQADLVIFDSPPVLVAADAQILSSQMDGTVLVVASGDTKKAAARKAMAILRQARANVLGIAYNKIRLDAADGYYYHYSTLPSNDLPVSDEAIEESEAPQLVSSKDKKE